MANETCLTLEQIKKAAHDQLDIYFDFEGPFRDGQLAEGDSMRIVLDLKFEPKVDHGMDIFVINGDFIYRKNLQRGLMARFAERIIVNETPEWLEYHRNR